MLYVKIMSSQDLPDTDQNHNYTIVPVENNEVMEFVQDQDPKTATSPRYALLVHGPDGGHETHPLTGNAYVMNESGKTIATHGC